MFRLRKAAGRRPAVVALVCAAALTVSQGQAFAAADWRLPGSPPVSPGDKVSLSLRVICGQGPCDYSGSFLLVARALGGAHFVTSEGTSFGLVKAGNQARVGSCQVEEYRVVCRVDGSGSVADAGDGLVSARSVTGIAPAESSEPAFSLSWSDS
ncbi:hypothetical protein H8N00_28660 [Streptomyces sp. AC563]|uniref:hypothetical protein n=1 Tax=Streptomyces buecherae TaxID=2763006 RepID=UPI00164E229C|nr:hypothetical protein [Streptomyces buecherae]MBC3992774.1 hypothetical protein [Streptomyces buecherae]